MIELKKVTSGVAALHLQVFSIQATTHVNKMSRFSVEKNYNWRAEEITTKPALYICNQCIHAYVSFVNGGPDRNWSDLLVVSDYDRNDLIWRIPIITFITLFDAVANDQPTSIQLKWDEKINDYRIIAD